MTLTKVMWRIRQTTLCLFSAAGCGGDGAADHAELRYIAVALSSAIGLRRLTWLQLHLCYSGPVGNLSILTVFTHVMGS